MRPLAWPFLILLLCPLVAAAEKERVWTNTDGRSMRAQFLREVDGEAVFLKDGKPVTIQLDQLSEPDRKLIRELSSGNEPPASGEATPENPFQPVDRTTGAQDVPFPSGDRAPSLTKQKTPVVSRDWTDIDGNRFYGRFVRVYERTVLILKPGPRPENVNFDRLSPEDQSYINMILTERGERPMAPFTRSADQNALSFDPPGGNHGPASLPGNSQFFQELRRKQEERRQEQAKYAAEGHDDAASQPMPGEVTDLPPSANPTTANPHASIESDPPVPVSRPRPPVFTIDAKTLAELRPVFIVGAVVIGLFAVIGFIVFIATTIAGNSRRQRYL